MTLFDVSFSCCGVIPDARTVLPELGEKKAEKDMIAVSRAVND